ncbi:hypothetical protein MANES_17G121850v8 [Manihot esculenta]|uniref:Uncharacterized protein n=1 Tax=Manihot esculenta TaxID=3983 RepID=A0ACB7G4P3_MANES|nr:hypothetical protein MANES_17G121850v8 [Manihot esculenta]
MWPIYSTSEEFIAKAPILEPKTQNRTCSSPKICIVCNLPLCSRFFTANWEGVASGGFVGKEC